MTTVLRLGAADRVAFTPDSSSVIATRPRKVIRWDLASGSQAASFPFRDGKGADCTLAGDLAVVTNTKGAAVVLTVDALEPVHQDSRRAALGEGPSPRFGPGREYVQATWDGDLTVRDALTGEVIWHEQEPGRMISAVACTPDRALFAYASLGAEDLVVRVRRWPFDVHAAEHVVRCEDDDPAAEALAVSGDGRGGAASLLHARRACARGRARARGA